MFQFSGFPSIHYGFMHGSQVLHLRGFPIRKSADRSLFAAPRSLSQLVTSFVGSWCQGIHLMLFLAWTSSFFQFSNKKLSLVCLSLANNWLGYHLLFWKDLLLFSPCLTICSFCYPINGKTLLNHCWSGIFRFHKIFLNYLFVSYFTFIRFSMNILVCFKFALRANLVGLSGLEPPTSRLSGARSNQLSYKPILLILFGVRPA